MLDKTAWPELCSFRVRETESTIGKAKRLGVHVWSSLHAIHKLLAERKANCKNLIFSVTLTT